MKDSIIHVLASGDYGKYINENNISGIFNNLIKLKILGTDEIENLLKEKYNRNLQNILANIDTDKITPVMYNSVLKNKKKFDKPLRQKYKAAALKTINSKTTIASDIYLGETEEILKKTRGCISQLKSWGGCSQTSKILNAIDRKNKPK